MTSVNYTNHLVHFKQTSAPKGMKGRSECLSRGPSRNRCCLPASPANGGNNNPSARPVQVKEACFQSKLNVDDTEKVEIKTGAAPAQAGFVVKLATSWQKASSSSSTGFKGNSRKNTHIFGSLCLSLCDKHHGQKKPVEKKVYFSLQLQALMEGGQERNSRQRP